MVKQRLRWTAQTEALLLDLWESNLMDLRRLKRNSHIYENIARMLNSLAKSNKFVVDAFEVRNKINNFTQRYRLETRAVGASGEFCSEWIYYEKIHKILNSSANSESLSKTDNIEALQLSLNKDNTVYDSLSENMASSSKSLDKTPYIHGKKPLSFEFIDMTSGHSEQSSSLYPIPSTVLLTPLTSSDAVTSVIPSVTATSSVISTITSVMPSLSKIQSLPEIPPLTAISSSSANPSLSTSPSTNQSTKSSLNATQSNTISKKKKLLRRKMNRNFEERLLFEIKRANDLSEKEIDEGGKLREVQFEVCKTIQLLSSKLLKSFKEVQHP